MEPMISVTLKEESFMVDSSKDSEKSTETVEFVDTYLFVCDGLTESI